MRDQANIEARAQEGITTVLKAALVGDEWGAAATMWQEAFQAELERPNATSETMFSGLNAIGAAINNCVFEQLSQIPGRIVEPVGMAFHQDGESKYFLMILNKDATGKMANLQTVLAGGESATVLKLGPFITSGQ